MKKDCDENCEECDFCVVEKDMIRSEDTEVWCTKYNITVGYGVDDYDYDENPIQRIVYNP